MNIYKFKRGLFTLGFIVLVGVLIEMILRPADRRLEQQILQPSAPSGVSQNAMPLPSVTAEPISNPAAAEVLKIAPTRDQTREEVAQNPHTTPKSLIFFASKMAEKFKIARTSEQNARVFYRELDECLTSSELRGADSTQALCLRDAQRIAQIFPALHDEFERLRSEATPTVQALVFSLNQTGDN